MRQTICELALLHRSVFFYGYPVQVEESAPASIDFSYTCELTVQGRMEPTAPARLSACESRRYSEIDPELAQEVVVKNFFAELDLDEVEDPLEKARRIYAQLVETKRFKKTKEPSQDLASSIHVVLNDDGGHCITLSNTFIALCRLQGIAAREVTGALAGYPAGKRRFEIAVYNEILFGHTWAEVFAPERGWVPVEFHGIVIGSQAGDGRQCRRRGIALPYRRSRRPLRRFLFWPVGLPPRGVLQFGQGPTTSVGLARDCVWAAIPHAGGLTIRVPACL